MKLFYIFASLLLCGSEVLAQTGFDRGNGGDVVQCSNPNGETSLQLLDLYELKIRSNFSLWNKLDGDHYAEVLEKVLLRIKLRYPHLEISFQELLNDFNNEVSFVSDDDLQEINDEGHVSIAPNCILKQIAVQFRSTDLSQRRYYIKKDLWAKLSPIDQAALILHELTYRRLILHTSDTEPTSNEFRGYIAYIFSEDFNDFSISYLPPYLRK